ncbi:hypothetical protein [Cryptosporangium phraense]|uniref:Uncharacterized protein n=1 Tax=Cryptosporangium phraense TaxID=2593070 RepID=A0A545AKK7_9ACTN|nr:hypothetical protein [Cryptosporangium phraense]TQS41856.1 hypothetical protein FL583_27925 [Cryptosporangium phraense]
MAGTEVDDFVRALLSAAPPSAPGTELPAVAGEPTPVLQVQLSGNVVVELNSHIDDMQRTTAVGTTAVAAEPADQLGEETTEEIVPATGEHDVTAGAKPAEASTADEASADPTQTPEPGPDDPPAGRPGPDPVV